MPNLQRGGAHASILLTLLYIFAILATQRGGPWPNGPPPLNTPLTFGTKMRLVKAAKASPHAKFYNLSTDGSVDVINVRLANKNDD